jgi:hypothetical protein
VIDTLHVALRLCFMPLSCQVCPGMTAGAEAI